MSPRPSSRHWSTRSARCSAGHARTHARTLHLRPPSLSIIATTKPMWSTITLTLAPSPPPATPSPPTLSEDVEAVLDAHCDKLDRRMPASLSQFEVSCTRPGGVRLPVNSVARETNFDFSLKFYFLGCPTAILVVVFSYRQLLHIWTVNTMTGFAVMTLFFFAFAWLQNEIERCFSASSIEQVLSRLQDLSVGTDE